MAFNDSSFRPRMRRKKCRFCGRVFLTDCPAKKTCDRIECRVMSLALIKVQNKKANDRYQARKRRKYVKGL